LGPLFPANQSEVGVSPKPHNWSIWALFG
jgi:hypothetical protein